MAQGRTAAQEMILWSLGFAAIALITAIAIRWTYPFSHEHDFSRHSKTIWFAGYILSIIALSTLVLVASMFWSKRLGNQPALAAFLAGLSTFAVLLLYSVVVIKRFPSGFGLGIIDLMNAKFLAEWQFIRFIGVISPICSILAAAMTWVGLRYGASLNGPQASSMTPP